MSKTNPNQDAYKTAGSSQSDGPDRGDNVQPDKVRMVQTGANAKHPAVQRSAKRK